MFISFSTTFSNSSYRFLFDQSESSPKPKLRLSKTKYNIIHKSMAIFHNILGYLRQYFYKLKLYTFHYIPYKTFIKRGFKKLI